MIGHANSDESFRAFYVSSRHAVRMAKTEMRGVSISFVASDDGVVVGELTECFNPNAAVVRAEALSRNEGYVGAVAFSRTGDPATGEFAIPPAAHES
jgi:hypothetical protein